MILKKLIIFLPSLKSLPIAQVMVGKSGCGAVGSVSGLGPEGRQFEPGHPDN
jgi:hypothetical protein